LSLTLQILGRKDANFAFEVDQDSWTSLQEFLFTEKLWRA
jgi:hypothetical protein